MFSKWRNIFVVLIMSAIFMAGIAFALQGKDVESTQVAVLNSQAELPASTAPVYVPPQKLSNPPDIVKAVYATGYSSGNKKYLDYLSNLFKTTEINSVVVDVKGSSGYVSYASGVGDVKEYGLYSGAIKDIDSLIRFFHDQNIYVIARIAVFEDPMYSKAKPELAVYNKSKTTDPAKPVLWQDNNGLSWLDPASEDVWNYNISLAKDAFYHGFDEVNFDYVRFPSDGKIGDMGFPVWDVETLKADVIKNFFAYLRQQLLGNKISVDLFGQTTSNKDDMGIGQIIENAFQNFDYVCPMVYPSHYANNFIGFSNPAEHPYEVVKYSMAKGLAREKLFWAASAPGGATASQSKFRPWLQDFNMGADYTAEIVKAEITATQDALGSDFSGFMLWNPSNIYTKEAVLK